MTSNQQPATPVSRNAPQTHAHSVSHSHFRTPISPASPYTPMSLRSFASSNSSALVTPRSDQKMPAAAAKRLSMSASQPFKSAMTSPSILKDRSYDIAPSWRSRASDNGIRVATAQDDYYITDDSFGDQSFSDVDDQSFLATDEAMAAAPFLAARRRRAVSQSQDMLPTTLPSYSNRPMPTSPLARRNPQRSQGVTQTPPPNRILAKEMKMKGSHTAPAQPRKRQALGNVPLTSPNVLAGGNADVSNLFNIDESYEYDYDHDMDIQDSDASYDFFTSSPPKHHHDSLSSDFSPFPILGGPAHHISSESIFGQSAFTDPYSFHRNGQSLLDGSQHHIQSFQPQMQPWGMPLASVQPFVPNNVRPVNMHTAAPSAPNTAMHQMPALPLPLATPRACSVCSRVNPARLAILSPCNHPLCSACLTSALNIVGEKDMECAVCKKGVDDFKLINPQPDDNSSDYSTQSARQTPNGKPPTEASKSILENMFSSPSSAVSGLESAFELIGPFGSGALRSSTPPRRTNSSVEQSRDPIVLRIDNVPWDITPGSISAWLEQPIIRAHVLLDRKGKTMSHAFVEVDTAQIAGSILRGETCKDKTNGVGKQGRSAVLGRGRRARGVTITRSSQEELMAALFPSWNGSFNGAQPTMLSPSRAFGQQEVGLMSDSEIASLLYLIRSPDAHFLKVPSLPFHVLMSILDKLPSDKDNRLYSSAPLRDTLYDVTYAAVQVLQTRIKEREEKSMDITSDGEYTKDLLREMVHAGSSCKAFTPFQSTKVAELVESTSSGTSNTGDADADIEDATSTRSGLSSRTPSSVTFDSAAIPMDKAPVNEDEHAALAREFGVDAMLIQALAQRLAAASKA